VQHGLPEPVGSTCGHLKAAMSRRSRASSRPTFLQIGNDGDPKTENHASGPRACGRHGRDRGLHELLRDFKIEVYEASAYAGEADVWSVKFMPSGPASGDCGGVGECSLPYADGPAMSVLFQSCQSSNSARAETTAPSVQCQMRRWS
jgi:hypothetical protein